MRITNSEILRILPDAKLVNEQNLVDKEITSVETDSRKVKKGSLFVCLKGENSDGHDFVQNAVENGANVILAQREIKVNTSDMAIIYVNDCLKALGKLAAYTRSQTGAKVIGITGTAGKTTFKDALKTILAEDSCVLATEKNYNNQLGVPLTILNASGNEKYWVIELGISHAQDMDELGEIVKPDIAVIINVGPGHCEGLSKKGVAWHKARLLKYVANNGCAILNLDYPELVIQSNEYHEHNIKKIFFSAGDNPEANFYVSSKDSLNGSYEITMNASQDRKESGEVCAVTTPFHGNFGAELASGIVAVCKTVKLDCSSISHGFCNVSLPEQRFKKIKIGNWLIFDDTYNANPLSMFRMLESVSDMAKYNNLPLYLVLGEMGELGEEAQLWHTKLGEKISRINCKKFFWKGNHYLEVGSGLSDFANNPEIKIFETINSVDDFMKKSSSCLNSENGGIILFKGSRLNHLEDYLKAFQENIKL